MVEAGMRWRGAAGSAVESPTVFVVRIRDLGFLAVLVTAVASCGDGEVTLPRDREPYCSTATAQAPAPPPLTTLPGQSVITIVMVSRC